MKKCFLFLITLNAYSATQPSGCGVYDIYGKMSGDKNSLAKYVFRVNEGSLSEYTFKLSSEQERLMAPYLGRTAKIKARITHELQGFQGELIDLKTAEAAVPDPAQLTKERGFILVKREKCQ